MLVISGLKTKLNALFKTEEKTIMIGDYGHPTFQSVLMLIYFEVMWHYYLKYIKYYSSLLVFKGGGDLKVGWP